MKSNVKDCRLPNRATENSAGYDFRSPYEIDLRPGEWVRINTGICFDGSEKLPIPRQGRFGKFLDRILGVRYCDRWCMKIYPRSGLGMKYGMRFSNTVGIIDADYRNNIILDVTVDKPYTIQKGERIAQGILEQYYVFEDEEKPTEKRTGGMGSTGKV